VKENQYSAPEKAVGKDNAKLCKALTVGKKGLDIF